MPDGEIVAVNVAAEEITERKRAEREIRSARDAAETALRHLRDIQDTLIEAEKLRRSGAWLPVSRTRSTRRSAVV